MVVTVTSSSSLNKEASECGNSISGVLLRIADNIALKQARNPLAGLAVTCHSNYAFWLSKASGSNNQTWKKKFSIFSHHIPNKQTGTYVQKDLSKS